ncbi:hypothetical protein EUGRSUZ_A00576 [Eucalyptus grandis]|uniref:Uncharacterized protein n=2 Tax=Eucalyptus grandis TaxID=71139 RepID=A0ACC3M1I0_EUCGR|nr:hypothetical protein EUGRSUZ_A00576 [Eucalyptus grandis]
MKFIMMSYHRHLVNLRVQSSMFVQRSGVDRFSSLHHSCKSMRILMSAHQLVNCDICGTNQLRKNIQWHLRTHEKKKNQLIRKHSDLRPFGDFYKFDEQFRSRPIGGRKRKCPMIKSLLQKRVTLPNERDFLSD